MTNASSFLVTLLVLLAVTASSVVAATPQEEEVKQHRVHRHRNVLQISQEDASLLNSLWEMDGIDHNAASGRDLKVSVVTPPKKGMKKMGMMGGKKSMKSDKKPKRKGMMGMSKSAKNGLSFRYF